MVAVLASAGLHKAAQASCSQDLLADARAGRLKHLVCVRGFDCTPRLLQFGSLTTTISPHARYIGAGLHTTNQDYAGKARLVSFK
eukprot:7645617-Alexandrium_andersonii.AAC.1